MFVIEGSSRFCSRFSN